MQLSDLYRDFAAVLRSAPYGEAVLSQNLLPEQSESVAVADILSAASDTSIGAKLQQELYANPYHLFHDLKLAFGRLIAQYPQNAPEYDEIAKLFKFAIDLLVREADRLGFTARHRSTTNGATNGGASATNGSGASAAEKPEIKPETNGEASIPPSISPHTGFANPQFNDFSSFPNSPNDDEYLFQISQGFQSISSEVEDWNGETYWVTAANGPLFMSVNNKAPIDPRDTAVAGSVHTVKLLPHVARAPDSTLGFVSPLNQRFPQPELPPTDLLSRFVHPNAHGTFSPLWLTGQDGYSGFAPASDSAGAVVGGEHAALVWSDKANRAAAAAAAAASAAGAAAAGASPAASTASAAAPRPTDEPKSEEPTKLRSNSPEMPPVPSSIAGLAVPPGGGPVGYQPVPNLSPEELEALLRWTPYSFVDDDEIEAAKSGADAEVKLVSSLLLELQAMQTERLSTPGDTEISDHERHIALKSANVLSRLVDGAKSDQIKLELDTRLPVLMRNYAGSLPAATDPFMQGGGGPMAQAFGGSAMPPQSQRLQTIAGLRSRSRSSRR